MAHGGAEHHGGGLAQLETGQADVGLDQQGAADRVGRSGHFAHGGGQPVGRGPAAHLQATHLADHATHMRAHVFGHREHHVARAIVGQRQHRLACSHHLARLQIQLGHHAVGASHQAGIACLVALHASLGLGLAQGRFGAEVRGNVAVVFGFTDEGLGLELLEALQVGRSLSGIGLGGRQASLGGGLLQLEILGIQLGQRLAGTHRLPQLHLALGDLARHAEGQPRFHAGTHLGRVFAFDVPALPRHHQGSGRAFDGRRRLLLAAGRQATHHQNHTQGRQAWAPQSNASGDHHRLFFHLMKSSKPAQVLTRLLTRWSVISAAKSRPVNHRHRHLPGQTPHPMQG
jgi:hypothetical protein